MARDKGNYRGPVTDGSTALYTRLTDLHDLRSAALDLAGRLAGSPAVVHVAATRQRLQSPQRCQARGPGWRVILDRRRWSSSRVPDWRSSAASCVAPCVPAAGLAVLLALLGALLGALRLGWHRPAHAASLAGQALAHTARLALGAGWPLLVAAAGLALGVFLSDRRGRAALGRLWAALGRLWAAPAITVARWLLTAAGLVAVLVVVIAVLPPRFTAARHFDKAADELKAQNDVRTTLLQALAGGVFLLGAYFTYRQLRVTREGQITDRYTKAVDQLGREHLDVRLGGIYALERIARDSPDDRATIEEVLTAYVRGHASWPPLPSTPAEPTDPQPTAAAAPQPLATASPAAGMDTAGRSNEKAAEPQRPRPTRRRW
jgi:hypothetical protein